MYEELTRAPDALAQALAPDETERAHRDAIAARLAAARRVFLTGCGTALAVSTARCLMSNWLGTTGSRGRPTRYAMCCTPS